MSIGIWEIAGIVILVILILILRSRSVETIKPLSGTQLNENINKSNNSVSQVWTDTYKGIPYTVESYDGETMTIEIEVSKDLSKPLEINARLGRPTIEESSRRDNIEGLLNLGANYVDIGFNTNRVAAELPMESVVIDKHLTTKVVDYLIRLRDQSQ